MNTFIQKYQLSEHVFSHPFDAKNKSMGMGLEGRIHVADVDGQAMYMPGATHKEYMDYMRQGWEETEEVEEEPEEETWIQALRIVLETLMKKSDKDFQVLKVDEEQKIIYGWGSVTKVNDELIVDRQGDIIETNTLVKAINEFMEGVRVGKVMHEGEQVGQIIHSFPVTKEIGDALGIHSDKEGWIVGYKVYDEEIWKDVKSGKYAAFSIGGSAVKEEL